MGLLDELGSVLGGSSGGVGGGAPGGGLGGALGGVLGQVLGGGGGGSNATPQMAGGLAQAAIEMLTRGGGTSGLAEAFARNGLGSVLSSWISTGQNLPVSADQIGQVLGPDGIASLASRFGIPADAVGQILSKALPTVVDHATPTGRVPEGGLLDVIGGLLK